MGSCHNFFSTLPQKKFGSQKSQEKPKKIKENKLN